MKLVAVAALAGVVVLAGCSSTGTAGTGSVTPLNTPAPVARTLSADEVAAVAAPRTKEFKAAAKAFRKCDRPVASDNFVSSPCLKKANAETAVVDAFLADLAEVEVPPTFASTLNSLERMSEAGAAVAQKCAKANDQKCDQALARFRADEQSLLWDLDIQL